MSNQVTTAAQPTLARAPIETTHVSNEALHQRLAHLARERLVPSVPDLQWMSGWLSHADDALEEHCFLESERERVAERAADVPRDAQRFAAWFEGLRETGPGQYDPLFDFLARDATCEQVRWFVCQEVAGEAGFDDLVALTQLRMPTRPKLEMAANYWDEMGRGKVPGMHGPLLHTLAQELEVAGAPIESIVWESLALANLLVGLAFNRRYAFHSVGALGVIELTAPTRAPRVVEALERVGLSGSATHYFRLHSTIDISHFAAWKTEVLIPLVAERPELAPHIAEGALMRLEAGARTFARYKREFGLDAPRPACRQVEPHT